MEQKSGKGIFYGVIGVATLIVAIIGATFAYFTATAGSAENAVNTGSAVVGLSYVDDTTGIKGELIPAYNAVVNNYVGNTTASCKDANGYNVCSVYKFTITNTSDSEVNMYFSADVASATMSDMYYRIIKVAKDGTPNLTMPTEISSDTKTTSIVVPATKQSETSLSTAIATITDKYESGAAYDYYIVMWIAETGSAQTTGGEFKATITAEAADASGKKMSKVSGSMYSGEFGNTTGTSTQQ